MSTSHNAQEEIAKARTLAERGDTRTATAILGKIIQREPGSVETWLALADVVEEPERIEQCLQKVLELDPGNVVALQKLASLRGGRVGKGGLGESAEIRPTSEGPRVPESSAARLATAGVEQPEVDQPRAGISWPGSAHSGDEASNGSELPDQPSERSFPRRLDLVLIGLTALVGLVLCGLVGASVIRNSSLFARAPTETPDEVVQVIFDNVIASNREDLAGYMATIHPDSPGYETTRANIQQAFTFYDLTYEIFLPEILKQGESESVVSYELTTRKVSGPAFRDNVLTGEMTLRKNNGVWKIYGQTIDNVEYLN